MYLSNLFIFFQLCDAKVNNNDGGILKEKSRSGQVSWIQRDEETYFNSLNARIETIAGYSFSSGEKYQIVNYGIGGHYMPHYDAFYKEHVCYTIIINISGAVDTFIVV